jgi:putative ATP-binding cassette transporter
MSSLREVGRIVGPYFSSEERWSAIGLSATIIAAQLALVGAAVAENYWRNAFFQTLQDRDWTGFLAQFGVYCIIGIVFVLATVYQRYLTQWLTIRWRRWLTARYIGEWLDGPVHYRAALGRETVDNPDQRIADDVRLFIDGAISLTVGLIGAAARIVSFVAVLWTLSNLVPLRILGETYVIPGYLSGPL